MDGNGPYERAKDLAKQFTPEDYERRMRTEGGIWRWAIALIESLAPLPEVYYGTLFVEDAMERDPMLGWCLASFLRDPGSYGFLALDGIVMDAQDGDRNYTRLSNCVAMMDGRAGAGLLDGPAMSKWLDEEYDQLRWDSLQCGTWDDDAERRWRARRGKPNGVKFPVYLLPEERKPGQNRWGDFPRKEDR